MKRFYFHLWTGQRYELDETGIEFETADGACLEAIHGAREIWFDLLRSRGNASGYRFDVFDDQGRSIYEISFAEALGQRIAKKPAHNDCLALVNRGYALASELNREIALARKNLEASRELIAIGAPHVTR